MSRSRTLLTLAALAALALGTGCDTYGLDDPAILDGGADDGGSDDGGSDDGDDDGGDDDGGDDDGGSDDGDDGGGDSGAIDTAALESMLGCGLAGIGGLDGSVAGALTDGDCTLRASRFYEYDGGEAVDAYAFRVTQETTVRFDLQSGAFDAYLIVTDADGDVVAFNDDAGPGNPATNENARLETTLPPGTYLALATSYFNGERGSYALTMTPR